MAFSSPRSGQTSQRPEEQPTPAGGLTVLTSWGPKAVNLGGNESDFMGVDQDGEKTDGLSVSKEVRSAKRLSPTPMFTAGTLVDHFKIRRQLGRGGMGSVFLARDNKLGRAVALKIINPALLGSTVAVHRFVREAQVTAKFSHPHIVTVYAVGDYQGCPYLALEYLEGQNLRQRLVERQLSMPEVLRLALAIAEALSEAHEHGVLHRDLKPENVIVARDGRPRVVDFGLAKTVVADEPPPDGSVVESSAEPTEQPESLPAGTPNYMAPEQWLQEGTSPATDIWALGVMLFELCTGQLPFKGAGQAQLAVAICGPEPPPRVDEFVEVPLDLAVLIWRCLSKEPKKRPSAAEMAQGLRELLYADRRDVLLEENPFRGLLPFTERQTDFFFGREAEIDGFIERVRLQPILPVVGPSGAGKSSFVQAGVIPRLREQEPWVVLKCRPGSRPLVALATRLLRSESETSLTPVALDSNAESQHSSRSNGAEQTGRTVAELAEQLRQTPRKLSIELATVAEQHHANVLLFVDQLEELFTLVDDPAICRSFMEAICAAADDPQDPVRVVFTIRDDFLGRMATSAPVRAAVRQLTILQILDAEALADVVLKPIEAVGYSYEDRELPREMVDQVSGESACLPLLQFAGQVLWEKRDKGRRLLMRSAFGASPRTAHT